MHISSRKKILLDSEKINLVASVGFGPGKSQASCVCVLDIDRE